MKPKTSSYCDAMVAPGRAPEIPAEDDIYGWLVGSWEQELTIHDPDGSVRRTAGEAHFSWGLEGRAIVDVWINPRRKDRPSLPSRFADWYGTTLRVYDPSLRAWRITWRDPSRGVFMDQIARRVGQDIMQEGKGPDGATYRWTFREITADSFHWTGEVQPPNQTVWTLQVDIRSRRIPTSHGSAKE
jgi:hypothetical protein